MKEIIRTVWPHPDEVDDNFMSSIVAISIYFQSTAAVVTVLMY